MIASPLSPARTCPSSGHGKGISASIQKAVAAYAASDLNIQKEVCDLCPTRCMEWNGKELKIYNEDCNRCMHCINLMPKALRPGEEKGATILIGGKAPIVEGALLSWVIVPFMKLEPPYTELKDLIERIIDWWDENGKSRERLGELIKRVGMRVFLRAVGLPAVASDGKGSQDQSLMSSSGRKKSQNKEVK